MTMLDRETDTVLHSSYQRSVAEYWNNNPNDDRVNVKLGEVDGLYHHHYGIGEPDWSVLEEPDDTRQDRIVRELHRLETAQADVLLDHLGDVRPGDRLLDAGCGRGGTSIMANQRFGCTVDGVTISEYQVGFANDQARQRNVHESVRSHFRNMLEPASSRAACAASGPTRRPCTSTCTTCSPNSRGCSSRAAGTCASPAAPTTSPAASRPR
ncbi:SAM-dependent methyltransferase [Nocardia blacklockiae]|uniref:SAM-dependent methyltransferase n=1 Tax=Nocardia blacklockiae TaxID=480036 RepID=UPI001E344F54|nr:class I SAM-dependent methyltransferase [Nocardia blacklockiae]